MGIVDTISGYLVPIIKGIFIFFFTAMFVYFIYLGLKSLGIGRLITKMAHRLKKNKLLANDEYMKMCIMGLDNNLTDLELRKKLLRMTDRRFRNEQGIAKSRFKVWQIDEIIYLYGVVKKEMKGGE